MFIMETTVHASWEYVPLHWSRHCLVFPLTTRARPATIELPNFSVSETVDGGDPFIMPTACIAHK